MVIDHYHEIIIFCSAKRCLGTRGLRREIKADIRKQHALYVNYLVGGVKAKPRDFYRYINIQRKDTQGIPPLKKEKWKWYCSIRFRKKQENLMVSSQIENDTQPSPTFG